MQSIFNESSIQQINGLWIYCNMDKLRILFSHSQTNINIVVYIKYIVYIPNSRCSFTSFKRRQYRYCCRYFKHNCTTTVRMKCVFLCTNFSWRFPLRCGSKRGLPLGTFWIKRWHICLYKFLSLQSRNGSTYCQQKYYFFIHGRAYSHHANQALYASNHLRWGARR